MFNLKENRIYSFGINLFQHSFSIETHLNNCSRKKYFFLSIGLTHMEDKLNLIGVFTLIALILIQKNLYHNPKNSEENKL